MSAAAIDFEERPEPGGLRWGGSLLVVLGIHAGAAVGMLAWHVPMMPPEAPPPAAAVMLDLAPLPTAPPQPAEPPPPTLEQMLPEPEVPPEPVVEPMIEPIVEPEPLPPPPVPVEVAMPEKPKPKPKPKEPPKPTPPKVEPPKPRAEAKPAPQTPPAPAAAASTTAPAAPAVGTPSSATASVSRATPSWQGLLLGHLERHKRYPRSAQARRQEGVAQVRFTLDREGRVLSVRLEKTSGFESLDEETVAMVQRASPLPAPPPEIAQDRMELVVPVQFFLR